MSRIEKKSRGQKGSKNACLLAGKQRDHRFTGQGKRGGKEGMEEEKKKEKKEREKQKKKKDA